MTKLNLAFEVEAFGTFIGLLQLNWLYYLE